MAIHGPTVALLSTSDTDLLSARGSSARYRWANPARATDAELEATTLDADLVVMRLLGSPSDLWSGIAALRDRGTPLVVLGGEQQPSADLMELSTVTMGVAAQAHRYLAEGGPTNLAQLHAFLCDTVLLTGEGFAPPPPLPPRGLGPRAPPNHQGPARGGGAPPVLWGAWRRSPKWACSRYVRRRRGGRRSPPF